LQNLQQKIRNNFAGAQRGASRRFYAGIHRMCAIFFDILPEILLAQKADICAETVTARLI